MYMKRLSVWTLANNAQALADQTESGHIEVMYMDQTVAQLWENSTAAREELPDQPVLVRRGIALGRIALQGQLPIMCSMAGRLLCLKWRCSTESFVWSLCYSHASTFSMQNSFATSPGRGVSKPQHSHIKRSPLTFVFVKRRKRQQFRVQSKYCVMHDTLIGCDFLLLSVPCVSRTNCCFVLGYLRALACLHLHCSQRPKPAQTSCCHCLTYMSGSASTASKFCNRLHLIRPVSSCGSVLAFQSRKNIP